VLYVVFMLKNIFTFYPRKKNISLPENYTPQLSVSIIIAARNEEENIIRCLQSIAHQEFPKEQLEILVVNDHSEDKTTELAGTFLKENFRHFKILHLAEREKGKKTAIIKAVEQSSGSVIITRDADTVTENNFWLKEIVFQFENKNCDLLISPVLLSGTNSFFSSFQKYENLAVTFLGLSMAKNKLPIVCSGANLAYKKEIFLTLDPYRNNLHIASGDDMFLLKAAFSGKCQIQPNVSANSLVYTQTEDTFKKAVFQRLRWASKTGKISTLPVFISGLILLFGNIACLIALIWPFIDSYYLPFCLFTLTIKFIIDFLLLFLSARMLNQKVNLIWYLPAFVINLIYTPTIALGSFFVKPNWKDRSI
jgi:cellulose synthase/poly-beta-1,6-N-acetylglucosamine synthase-like glycosyltransferase